VDRDRRLGGDRGDHVDVLDVRDDHLDVPGKRVDAAGLLQPAPAAALDGPVARLALAPLVDADDAP
jgi:hypothetical protein